MREGISEEGQQEKFVEKAATFLRSRGRSIDDAQGEGDGAVRSGDRGKQGSPILGGE